MEWVETFVDGDGRCWGDGFLISDLNCLSFFISRHEGLKFGVGLVFTLSFFSLIFSHLSIQHITGASSHICPPLAPTAEGGGVPPLILPGAGPSQMGRVQHPLASWKGEEESFVESW